MKKIRVMLVEDGDNMRTALCLYLRRFPDIDVVADAACGADAIKAFKTARPDVILMDLRLPDIDGIVLTRRATALLPEVKVIALTGYASVLFVRAMMGARAAGFIGKPVQFDKILKGIRTVMSGKHYFSSNMQDLIYEDYVSLLDDSKLDLTDQEWEILWRVSEGASSRQIGECMELADRTIEWYRQNLMDKTGRHSTAGLVRFAIEHSLLPETHPRASEIASPES